MELLALIEGENILYQKKTVGLSDTLENSCLTSYQDGLEFDDKEVDVYWQKKAKPEEDMVKEQLQKEPMAAGWPK